MFGWQPVRGIDKFGSVPAKCNKKLKRAICEYFGKSSQLLAISVEIRSFYYRIQWTTAEYQVRPLSAEYQACTLPWSENPKHYLYENMHSKRCTSFLSLKRPEHTAHTHTHGRTYGDNAITFNKHSALFWFGRVWYNNLNNFRMHVDGLNCLRWFTAARHDWKNLANRVNSIAK